MSTVQTIARQVRRARTPEDVAAARVALGQLTPDEVAEVLSHVATHDHAGAALLTAEEAAGLVRRSVKTISRWHVNGDLESVGVDDRGRRLFLEMAVYDAERKARKSIGGRPRRESLE